VLSAQGLWVGGSVIFDDGFVASGGVSLDGTQIGGQLRFRGATILNQSGPALVIYGSHVASDVFIDKGFRAEGSGEGGVVSLSHCRIDGRLFIRDAVIRSTEDGVLHLNLARAHVDAGLILSVGSLRSDAGSSLLVDLDGLTYVGIPRNGKAGEWLSLLRECTVDYTSQQYQQLALVHRAAGHEHDARRILIAQQGDLRRRGNLGGPLRRFVHWSSGVLIGYGFRSWRALVGLLATLLISIGLAFGASVHGLAVHPPGGQPGLCSQSEVLGLAIDQAIPLVSTGGKQRCQINVDTSEGQWLFVSSWGTQLLGWAFATLFVAGFTGIVRKS
jgi:hypothetical protein